MVPTDTPGSWQAHADEDQSSSGSCLPLYGAVASRAMDGLAKEKLRVTGFELMQRAAAYAFDQLNAHFPRARRLSVWCGKGNNGGDAWLVAALAAQAGWQVELISLVGVDELSGDARLAAEQALTYGINPLAYPFSSAEVSAYAAGGDTVIVDGLLGTGFTGALRAAYSQAIAAINQAAQRGACGVLSIDIPSGVSADTGAVQALAVQADVTATFIVAKAGLYTGQGRQHSGVVRLGSLATETLARDAQMSTVDADVSALAELRFWQPERLPLLEPATYKHRQGHVLLIGGDRGMPGAITLAAHACLRSGAGMVTVATHAEHGGILLGQRPELMLVDPQDAERFAEKLAAADVLVLGPGLGRDTWGEFLFQRVIDVPTPMVIDADGLYWLARMGVHQSPGPRFITPHTAEAAALLGQEATSVEHNRFEATALLASRYQADVVLKGPGSVVHGRNQMAVCGHGNPGMATAGMGDVLSGVIAGLLAPAARQAGAEGLSELFLQAVLLHSAAADAAAEVTGQRSLLAGDVIQRLPDLLRGTDQFSERG